MSNPIIGYPRYTQEALFSSENSFNADYGVENAGKFPFTRAARTNETTGICITATLSQKRKIELVVLCRHSILVNEATMRVKLYEDEAGTVLLHDSGEFKVWPKTLSKNQVDWDGGNWWDRAYTSEQKEGYPFYRPYLIPGGLYGRRVDVCIEAGGHVGPLDIGLIELAAAYRLPIGVSLGASYGFNSRSDVIAADGGVEYFDRKDKPRTFEGELPVLLSDDAKTGYFEFLRQTDTTEPFFWWLNPDDTLNQLRDSYMARNDRLGRLNYLSKFYQSVPINYKEWL